MFALAFLAGLIGYLTSSAGVFYLVERLASRIPEEKHVAFLTASWAHSASCLAGIVGGIILWIVTWRRRGKQQNQGEQDSGGQPARILEGENAKRERIKF